ncbi:MAG: arginine repressor [Lachnospiraceae bacterium]|nr:arginine repressor [Lachnospiraceae bacterium]
MKTARQSKIIELIEKNEIETQEELAGLLNEAGFKTTQATISRDIRELKLTKVTADNGRQKYIMIKSGESQVAEKYIRVLCDGFVSIDMAQNIIVIKTVSGMAMAVGAAIDSLHIESVVGCIAGDDTVMCAVKSVEDTERAIDKIKKFVAANRK